MTESAPISAPGMHVVYFHSDPSQNTAFVRPPEDCTSLAVILGDGVVPDGFVAAMRSILEVTPNIQAFYVGVIGNVHHALVIQSALDMLHAAAPIGKYVCFQRAG